MHWYVYLAIYLLIGIISYIYMIIVEDSSETVEDRFKEFIYTLIAWPILWFIIAWLLYKDRNDD